MCLNFTIKVSRHKSFGFRQALFSRALRSTDVHYVIRIILFSYFRTVAGRAPNQRYSDNFENIRWDHIFYLDNISSTFNAVDVTCGKNNIIRQNDFDSALHTVQYFSHG